MTPRRRLLTRIASRSSGSRSGTISPLAASLSIVLSSTAAGEKHPSVGALQQLTVTQRLQDRHGTRIVEVRRPPRPRDPRRRNLVARAPRPARRNPDPCDQAGKLSRSAKRKSRVRGKATKPATRESTAAVPSLRDGSPRLRKMREGCRPPVIAGGGGTEGDASEP